MCVIIAKPAGKELTAEEIERAWKRNPDGGGIVYRDKGKFVVYKSLKEDTYINYFKEHYNKDKNMLLHMRIKTHGAIDLENTHPFKTRCSGYFAHNGVITPEGNNKDKLDTLEFRDNIVDKLPDGWWKNDAIVKMMSEYIGYSKLAFLLPTDEFLFINEDKGSWVDGVWYSNRSHAYSTAVTTTNKYYPDRKQEEIWTGHKKMTSLDIVRNALNGDSDALIDITNIFKQTNGKVCGFCGIPLVTENEIDNGLCDKCFESLSKMIEED